MAQAFEFDTRECGVERCYTVSRARSGAGEAEKRFCFVWDGYESEENEAIEGAEDNHGMVRIQWELFSVNKYGTPSRSTSTLVHTE